jgi:hypothetical protein
MINNFRTKPDDLIKKLKELKDKDIGKEISYNDQTIKKEELNKEIDIVVAKLSKTKKKLHRFHWNSELVYSSFTFLKSLKEPKSQ